MSSLPSAARTPVDQGPRTPVAGNRVLAVIEPERDEPVRRDRDRPGRRCFIAEIARKLIDGRVRLRRSPQEMLRIGHT